MKYKIAVVQMDSGEEIESNLKKIERMTGEAAEEGASLVLFPEHSDYLGTDYGKNAATLSGERVLFFSECARKSHIYLHCGSIAEKNERERPYNTGLLFAPSGAMLGKYQKIHMFDVSLGDGMGYRESDVVMPGNEIVLCDTVLGRIGMAVCYDLRFPELFRIMAKQGAELITVSADFTANTGKDHWKTLLRARAIENTCYVAASGQCGKKPKFSAYGHSMIVDPWGDVLAMASGDQEEILYAIVDTDRMREVRRQLPSLANTREDVYHLSGSKLKICAEEAQK